MRQLAVGALIFGLTSVMAMSQAARPAVSEQSAGSYASLVAQPDESDLMHRIAQAETTLRSDKALASDPKRKVAIYIDLGSWYSDAGMFLKAEDAMKRAIALMKNGPQVDLAVELGQLAILHVQMGRMDEAEGDEQRALQAREAVGDAVGIAITWNDIAGLYDDEHKYKKAMEYGQWAFEVLADRQDVSADNQIVMRQTLGYALTANRNCDRGIAMLKDAVELAKSTYGEDSRGFAYPEYVLGFGYWHCGDRTHAAEWLERGTTLMKADFGWDRSQYVNAMKQYALFLRQDGQLEAAVSAETVVHEAEALVDARTLTGRAEGFRSAGSK